MAMTEAARAARNEYAREWRRKNPEKAAAIHERYWNKKAGKLSAGASVDSKTGKG